MTSEMLTTGAPKTGTGSARGNLGALGESAPRGACPRFRRGALLLEVVVAMAIMVAAMGVLGSQLVNGLRLTSDADRLTRASALVDRLLAMVEMDPQMQESILQEEQADGDFGEQYPGWFWEIEFQPVEEVEGLGQVRVAVLHQEDPERVDTAAGARIVRQVVLLKAAPGRIDLVNDFGMDEDQVEQLTELLPMADFDPAAVDPQMLVAALTENPEILLEMLPALMPLLQQYAANARGAAGAGGGDPFGPGGLAGQLGDELAGFGDEFGVDELAGVDGKDLPAGETPSVSDLVRLRDELVGAAPARPGGGRRGLAGARGGRGGGARGGQGGRGGRGAGAERGGGRGRGGSADPGRPQYTIEDLMRLRDEMMRQQGGG